MNDVSTMGDGPSIDHVSVSSLTCYLRCPRQYEYRYLSDVPPAYRAGALALGSAVHAALALFYGRLRQTNAEPSLAEVEREFNEAWAQEMDAPIPLVFDDRTTATAAREMGLALVRVFHEKSVRPRRVLGVEHRFSVHLVHPDTGVPVALPLVGFLDAMVDDGNDRVVLLEHKTAARRFSEDRLRYDVQATAYSLAAQQLGFGEVQVVFQLLLKTKQPDLALHSVQRFPKDHHDFITMIDGVLAAINVGAFYPVRDWHCRSCAWAGPCLAG
jgi:putative RecB family exonuclease